MQENTQGEEQSRPSETENSQEHQTKKVGKKARVFDLDTVLAQSIEGAKIRNAAGTSGGSALSSGGLSLQESIESLNEASENTNERVDFVSFYYLFVDRYIFICDS